MSADATVDGTPGTVDGPIPTGHWNNVTSNLANVPSGYANLTVVFGKPDEDVILAGVSANGLWASRSGHWQLLGTGSDASAPITNRPEFVVFDPANPMRYWVSGSYGPCVYETSDDGNTFSQLGSANHCDLVSIDFSDPNRQTLLAGAHEGPQTLYRSTNGGMTWQNVGAGLPAGTYCNMPLVIDAQTHLVGCSGVGVYRTTDGGATWTEVTSSGGLSAPIVESDNSIYWLSTNGGLTRSIDSGKTWSDVTVAGTLDTAYSLIGLPDGGFAAVGGAQSIVVSSDHGATWTPATTPFPITSMENNHGIAYSSPGKTFYIWRNNGADAVLSDAVMDYDSDY